MSRSRNIKPAFFKNEDLVELGFDVRLLFIGLWTLADREGRLEDRPVKIKMELFPADSVDIDSGLAALHSKGFIKRYQVEGKRYLQINAFAKHQNPHPKEAASVIPDSSLATVVPEEVTEITRQATEIPELAQLIPSSLIPSSLPPIKAIDRQADRFPEFWECQIRKVERKQCEAIWKKRSLNLQADVIIPAAKAYNASIEDVKFCKHPATWLNGECWNDEILPRQNAPPPKPSKLAQGLETLERMKHGLVQNRNTNGITEAGFARLGVGSTDGDDSGYGRGVA